jgi:hypothetical protein
MSPFKPLTLIAAGCFAAVMTPVLALGAETNAVSVQTIVEQLEYRDVKTPYLLAFSAQVDSRPLYVESALLVAELTNHTWRLVHAYRHPKERVAHFHLWAEATATDVFRAGHRDFGHRPSEADVEKFLHDSWWEFRASQDFRLLRGEVYYDTWKRTLGYRPKYEFPKQAG